MQKDVVERETEIIKTFVSEGDVTFVIRDVKMK